MRPDGAVRAIMGGRNYSESAFNRVTNAHRSPGSAFKPFVYLTALEKGFTRDTIRYDEPIAIKDWSPDNFDGSYAGAVTLQAALTRSINTVAIGLGQEVGLPSVISTAQRLGITSPLEPNASLAIGTSEVTPLELTAAYASFASLGYAADPYTVIEIRTADGSVVYQRAPQQPRRVIAEEDALAMNAMLFDVVLSGTGRGGRAQGPRGRRQDGHQRRLPRRVVHRLLAGACRGRVGRQRRFHADEEGDRRRDSRRRSGAASCRPRSRARNRHRCRGPSRSSSR